ncbi:MAG: sucrose phosphorylase [Nitriliruptoraceae bacterium]|nr:sucrose phosphorylase [Nitriliruptoraceae bacterium]
MRNQVQLITYADRLAGDLPGLDRMLAGPLAGAFGGVHVLPFFDPIDGADAGFDPADHRAVDPRLGTWADVEALGAHTPIMADLIVNHISSASPQFQDFLAHGEDSAWAGLFLTLDRVFPDGASEDLLTRIYRPRPGLPLTPVQLADRSRRIVWTTFTTDQIDIDVRSPEGVAYLDSILDRFRDHNIEVVRLDAIGYAIKTPGTSSFMTEETFAFIDELTARAHERGIAILVEVHSYWRRQVEIAARVDHVYDFALPPLVLHALYTGNAERLRHWCQIRPRNAVTVLDTHDGIGVIDVGPDTADVAHLGLLDADEIDALVEGIHEHSHDTSRLATGAAASNVDLYQVNCTFFDALGASRRNYLIARLLQLWLPGVPQIYYVGLLAGHNDVELLQRTGVGRDINRHHYTAEEVEQALRKPVVQRLLAACRLRNTHPAFAGTWELLDEGHDQGQLAMRWTHDDEVAELRVDLRERSYELRLTLDGELASITDLDELAA